MPNQQFVRNQDLVLRVSPSVDLARFDINRYEPFLDALCGNREYQKDAICTVLRYMLGGRYENLHTLARENFNHPDNNILRQAYRTFAEMERHLQFPDRLSCSVDLATGTGKSYVMYGVACIMLAEGAVDRVLVLCPSRTIEAGLLEKFRSLSTDTTLRDLLPDNASVRNPHIINGTESIVAGTLCIENCHATLRHVGSSVRASLRGKGEQQPLLRTEAGDERLPGDALKIRHPMDAHPSQPLPRLPGNAPQALDGPVGQKRRLLSGQNKNAAGTMDASRQTRRQTRPCDRHRRLEAKVARLRHQRLRRLCVRSLQSQEDLSRVQGLHHGREAVGDVAEQFVGSPVVLRPVFQPVGLRGDAPGPPRGQPRMQAVPLQAGGVRQHFAAALYPERASVQLRVEPERLHEEQVADVEVADGVHRFSLQRTLLGPGYMRTSVRFHTPSIFLSTPGVKMARSWF